MPPNPSSSVCSALLLPCVYTYLFQQWEHCLNIDLFDALLSFACPQLPCSPRPGQRVEQPFMVQGQAAGPGVTQGPEATRSQWIVSRPLAGPGSRPALGFAPLGVQPRLLCRGFGALPAGPQPRSLSLTCAGLQRPEFYKQEMECMSKLLEENMHPHLTGRGLSEYC